MNLSDLPFNIFKYATQHMCSTRILGTFRLLLGLTLVLFPYPNLVFHATWVWLLWVGYYLAALGILLGFKPSWNLAGIFCLLCYGLYSTASQDGVLSQQAQLLAVFAICLALTPSHLSFSLPAYVKQYHKEKVPRERGTLWAFRLIQIQTSTFLLFDGLSHFNQRFHTGDRIEQLVLLNMANSDPLPLMELPQFTSGVGILLILLPWLAAGLLWFDRLLPAGIALTLIYALFLQVMLPDSLWFLLLSLGALSFINPVWLHRIPAALYDT